MLYAHPMRSAVFLQKLLPEGWFGEQSFKLQVKGSVNE